MKKWLLFLVATGLVGIIGFAIGMAAGKFRHPAGNLAVVEIRGAIFESREILGKLDDYLDDMQVKAIVLRIESPGGAVGAAQEIYEAVLKAREQKPIVASIGSVGASGGYYIACAARKIFANPGSVTGSIGVLMETMNVEQLMAWAKLKPITFKSGRLKDMGSGTRPITDEEAGLFHSLLEKLHQQFRTAVATQRGLSNDQILHIADGRVYTGEEAKALNLIDELGGLSAAIDEAGRLANITGKPKVIYPERDHTGIIEYLFGAFASMSNLKLNGLSESLIPMFLWRA